MSYQTDANYAPLTENPEELKASPPSEQYDKVSPVEKKPVLSRASSRGERSESPLVKQKSPLTRRESRAQIQSYSPEYIPENVPESDYEPIADTVAYPDQQYYSEEPVAREANYEEYGAPYYPNQEAYRPPSRGGYQEPYQTENGVRKSSSGESSTHMQQPSAYDPYYKSSPERQPIYAQQDQQPVYGQQDQQAVYAPPDEGRKFQARSSRPPSTSEFEPKVVEGGHELVRQQSSVRRENSGKVVAPKAQRNTPTKFQ